MSTVAGITVGPVMNADLPVWGTPGLHAAETAHLALEQYDHYKAASDGTIDSLSTASTSRLSQEKTGRGTVDSVHSICHSIPGMIVLYWLVHH